ncbi:protein tamozhennic-like [Uranotaenia lowii]|uniref:protein tamozhennic-like n=1 Tax=Uranotaenia lowii TaxID=190385 RepID=UPI00247A5BC7|nr:protein tamozhennic-like [Uranotaenia lowii]
MPPQQFMNPVLPMPPVQQATMSFFGAQPVYNSTPYSIPNQPPYSYHSQFQNYLPNHPPQPTNPHHPPPPLPHSKSLEHYQVPSASMYNLTACMQRHSLDQPHDYNVSPASHYGGPMGMAAPSVTYDAVDGCGMAYNNHAYNVSGNRYPLPYQLSTNLSPYMNGNMAGKQNGTEQFNQQLEMNSFPPQISPFQPQRSLSKGHGIPRHTKDMYLDHNLEQPDTRPMTSILSKKKSYDDFDVSSTRRGSEAKHAAEELFYIDSNDEPKKERKKSELIRGFESEMLPKTLQERQHRLLQHQTSRNSRQSDFDSYEDEQLQAGAYQRANNVSKLISSKKQDGIGSYESWNFVYQKLEQQGYSKDLGERGDILVEDEDVNYHEGKTSRTSNLAQNSKDKIKKSDKNDGIRGSSTRQSQASGTLYARDNECNDLIARSHQKSLPVQNLSKLVNNNHTDNSQATNHSSHSGTSTINAASSSRRNSITRKISTTSNKDNGTTSNSSGGGILVNHNNSNHQPSASLSGKKKTTSFDTAGVTIINPQDVSSKDTAGGANEWNCKFCTFLNPATKRICEICSKSRDFDLNGQPKTTKSNGNGAATCV